MCNPSSAAGNPIGLFGDLLIATQARVFRVTTAAIDRTALPRAALYNSTLAMFVSTDSRDVTLWDADTGQSTVTFADASPSEIVCACFDDRERKLLIGTGGGHVHCLNLKNGAFMKQGAGHTGSVVSLIYGKLDRCLLSTGWDGSLAVWDEETQEALGPLRFVRHAHDCEVTALAYRYARASISAWPRHTRLSYDTTLCMHPITCPLSSPELSLVITGDRNGIVKAWDFQDLKLLAYLAGHRSVVTSASAARHLPLFVTSDAEGIVIIWSARCANAPFNAVYRFSNDAAVREICQSSFLEPIAATSSAVAEQDTTFITTVPSKESDNNNGANVGDTNGNDRTHSITGFGSKPQFDAMEASVLLARRAALSTFVDDVLAERALSRAVADGSPAQVLAATEVSANISRGEETKQLFMARHSGTFPALDTYAKAHQQNMHVAARVKTRETRVAISVATCQLIVPAFDDADVACDRNETHESQPGTMGATDSLVVYLAVGDDAGRIRVLDISRIIQRLGVVAVEPTRQPQRLPSYNSRRRAHRDEPGPVVTDDGWFYNDVDAAAEANNITKDKLLSAQEAFEEQRDCALDSESRQHQNSMRAKQQSKNPKCHPGMTKALDPAAISHVSQQSSMSPFASTEEAGLQRKHLSDQRRQSRGSKLLPRKPMHQSYGVATQIVGSFGVGIAAAARRRSTITASIMRRAGVRAGVANILDPGVQSLLASNALMRAVDNSRPLEEIYAADDNSITHSSRAVQEASMARARRKRIHFAAPLEHFTDDVISVIEWAAHTGMVTSLRLFFVPHVRWPHRALGPSCPSAMLKIPPFVGLFATSCGTDSRALVWNVPSGELVGELTNSSTTTNGNSKLSSAAPSRTTHWRFPPCALARAVVRTEEAADLMLDSCDRDIAKQEVPAAGRTAEILGGDDVTGQGTCDAVLFPRILSCRSERRQLLLDVRLLDLLPRCVMLASLRKLLAGDARLRRASVSADDLVALIGSASATFAEFGDDDESEGEVVQVTDAIGVYGKGTPLSLHSVFHIIKACTYHRMP